MPTVPPITCHILDTTKGRPAANVKCEISYLSNPSESIDDSKPFAYAFTNSDGRVPSWTSIPTSINSSFFTHTTTNSNDWVDLKTGLYRIRFYTKEYFEERDGGLTFFPFIDINFEVPSKPDKHYHVPLLLSNYGYSTYRGS